MCQGRWPMCCSTLVNKSCWHSKCSPMYVEIGPCCWYQTPSVPAEHHRLSQLFLSSVSGALMSVDTKYWCEQAPKHFVMQSVAMCTCTQWVDALIGLKSSHVNTRIEIYEIFAKKLFWQMLQLYIYISSRQKMTIALSVGNIITVAFFLVLNAMFGINLMHM